MKKNALIATKTPVAMPPFLGVPVAIVRRLATGIATGVYLWIATGCDSIATVAAIDCDNATPPLKGVSPVAMVINVVCRGQKSTKLTPT